MSNDIIEARNHAPDRRTVLKLLAATGIAGAATNSGMTAGAAQHSSFDPIEATIADVRSAIISEQHTAEEIVGMYLDRIDEYDSEVNSIITVNDAATDRASELDETFADSGLVGPLHGIPIILKDNMDTSDLPTTGGSVLFEESMPPDDAFLVEQLRAAGGIILGKANLGEFAWGSLSSLGGQTRNPYDLDRSPGGSSAGPGASIAANLGLVGMGSDTGGSVRIPAAFNSLVGLRPTTGLISRDGIIPLSETQDTAGPMTRTVTDTAIMLDTMVGYDPADPETSRTVGNLPDESYTAFLTPDGLDGKRLGVIRDYIESDVDESDPAGEPEAVTAVIEDALQDLEEAGATVVDPIELPGLSDLSSEADVMVYEAKRDLNAYIETLGDDAPVDSFTEVVESGTIEEGGILENVYNDALEIDADALDENVEYLNALNTRREIQELLLTTMVDEELDAFVYPMASRTPAVIGEDRPSGINTGVAPLAGFPAITVPAGFTAESELPVGIEFMARPYSEPSLLAMSYAYEQLSRARHPPDGFGSLS